MKANLTDVRLSDCKKNLSGFDVPNITLTCYEQGIWDLYELHKYDVTCYTTGLGGEQFLSDCVHRGKMGY
jgi:hypothetical protein